MLEMPFGLDPAVDDIDSFLIQKVRKKLIYQSSCYLSLSGRTTIVNQVLMATLWYFVVVQDDTSKVFGKITMLFQNFLWLGKEHRTQIRVSWHDCCVKKKQRGLSIINPKDAEIALWVVYAFLPGQSPIIRYKLSQMSPSRETKQPQNPQWSLISHHTSTLGSRVWGRIHRALNRMCKQPQERRPLCKANTASFSLQQNLQFKVGVYNISHAKALELHSKRMHE